MVDPEGRGAQEPPGERGRARTFLTSGPGLLGAIAALITAITGLIIGLNQAGIIGGNSGSTTSTPVTNAGGGGNSVTNTGGGGNTTATTIPQSGASRYFTPVTGNTGRVYFEGKTMYITASQPGNPMVVLANMEEPQRDVQLRVDGKLEMGATDFGVGFVCRYQNVGNYYFLSVLSKGGYNIGRYRGGKLTSLTGGIKMSSAVNAEMNAIRATCVGTNPTSLVLTVNGERLGAVQDPTGIEAGNVGIRVGSSMSPVTVGFDDFVMQPL